MKEKILTKISILFNNIKEDHISDLSAQCAYYLMLSFVPSAILILTIIQYMGLTPDEFLDAISKVIPENMSFIIIGIIREVYFKSIGTLSISAIFLLLSADKGLFVFTKGLNQIYNSTNIKKISWLNLKVTSIFQTILFGLIITLGLFIKVISNQIIIYLKEVFKNRIILYNFIVRFLIIVIAFIVILNIYKYLPIFKYEWKTHVNGAIFSSLTINIISCIFSKYLEIFKGFSTIYGSLTGVILIMMWTYSCFYTIFIGAEINKIGINIHTKDTAV